MGSSEHDPSNADELSQRLEALLGERVVSHTPLGGGCVADVRRVTLASGTRVVVKLDPERRARVEARMLGTLADTGVAPVPGVIACDDEILVLEHVEHGGGVSAEVERDAAERLAALHAHTTDDGRFGLGYDGLIGGLHQPNDWHASWPEFYADRRLRTMADDALTHGGLDRPLRDRVHRAADSIDTLLEGATNTPGLIHGDVWSGNVLTRSERVAAFIDPACHYADPEVELAFITMFSTFGDAFFERYHALRPIGAGFWERRRAVYVLYPLLVHARLFGGEYAASVGRTLDELGVR